ncbi:MAG TPA: hypothetical protein VJN22_08000 [Candidatus Eremiobacteraceae bacterium]|nr:hypothetical protein [Candidatus Eremiobacteraceae bacterium]
MIGAIRNVLCKHYIDRNHDPGASVLLASSGRAGSTWVAQVINYRNDYRLMFEPFREDVVPEAAVFRLNQYIRPTDKPAALLAAAENIFSGRVRHDWVDAYNRRLFVSRRLIKAIRVNLFLKWTRVNFPTMPVVLLLRHPCAVAQSRIALGWHMDLEFRFLAQPALVEDALVPFADAMRQASTEWERQIFAWCVENYVPLAQCSAGDVHIAFYENFCLNPEEELGRLGRFLKIPFDRRVSKALTRPSKTTRTGQRGEGISSVVSGADAVEAWRPLVSDDDLQRAMDIVRLFGLDSIYGPEPAPRGGAAVAAGTVAVASTQSWVTPGATTP